MFLARAPRQERLPLGDRTGRWMRAGSGCLLFEGFKRQHQGAREGSEEGRDNGSLRRAASKHPPEVLGSWAWKGRRAQGRTQIATCLLPGCGLLAPWAGKRCGYDMSIVIVVGGWAGPPNGSTASRRVWATSGDPRGGALTRNWTSPGRNYVAEGVVGEAVTVECT